MALLLSMRINKNTSSFNLLYSIFNKLLFKNKLPTVVVLIDKIKDQDTRGFFTHKDKKPIGIVINKEDQDPARVLLHEMCHVKLACVDDIWDKPDHPPAFIRELRRVYKKVGLALDPSEVVD